MPPLSQAGLPYSQGLKYHLRVDAQICITSLALSPTSEAPVELSAWRFTRTSLHLCRYKKEFLLILYSAGLSSHTPNLSERYQHQQSPRVHSACGNYCRTVPRREAGEHRQWTLPWGQVPCISGTARREQKLRSWMMGGQGWWLLLSVIRGATGEL